jgi:hypothetical protein
MRRLSFGLQLGQTGLLLRPREFRVGLLRHLEIPGEMPPLHLVSFARFQQPLPSVLTKCLEHSKAPLPGLVVDDNHRVVDQVSQPVEHLRTIDVASGNHSFSGFERPGTGEHCQPLENHPVASDIRS